ncbi:MAG: hypothetical protein K940chlam9_01926 [Chlamydiae bacterium]|nr:hypothetical protein [Chlamydiota bacterium]
MDLLLFTAESGTSTFFSGLNENEIEGIAHIEPFTHPYVRGSLQIAYCVDRIFSKILQDGMIETNSMQDNCCTWALEKLAMASIVMPNDKNGWFITDTRNYLDREVIGAVV